MIIRGLILSLVLFMSLPGSPLIFKATKEVKGSEFVELGTIDTKIFDQVRIAVEGAADDTIDDNLKTGKKFRVAVFAVEDGREIYLEDQNKHYVQFRTVIDTPPSKLRVKVIGETTYTIYVWASQ